MHKSKYMKSKVVLLWLIMVAAVSNAQPVKQDCASMRVSKPVSFPKATIAAAEENDYDVHYLKFNINLTNTNTQISGDVTTVASVKSSSMPVYAFELDPLIIIDSIKVNNQLLAAVATGAVRKVTLPSALPSGSSFTAQVFYHGQPASGTGQFFTGGLNHVQLPSGKHILYSISDRNFTDDWWPCKQELNDKIDSVDMSVTVDDSLKVGSNGLLKNVVNIGGNKVRYEWQTRYPIDYYLVCVAVAPYSEHTQYMHFTDGSNDSMLIQHFMYDSATTITQTILTNIDSTGYIVDHFSKLFGKYPYYKEKYGHCFSPLGGGMEHQTMTTMGTGAYTDVTLISHELGHQWWGDCVTYGSWRDIWLSEGFATYCEQLFVEHFRGVQAAQDYRTISFNSALGATTGSVYVDDTTSDSRIFSRRLTYDKGAAVAHMLRYIAPADSLFFKAAQQYQQQYKFGNAFTSDLQHVFEQVYGRSLDTFFNQWIYKEGTPRYSGKWYQSGDHVYIQLSQVTSKPSSVANFVMPVELKLQSASGDTIVKLYNDLPTQTFVVFWDKTMTGFSIDPNNNVLDRTGGSITQDMSITSTPDIFTQNIKLYPNPAHDSWYLENVPSKATAYLTDAIGRIVWTAEVDNNTTIPASGLHAGTYVLLLNAAGYLQVHYKLVKQ